MAPYFSNLLDFFLFQSITSRFLLLSVLRWSFFIPPTALYLHLFAHPSCTHLFLQTPSHIIAEIYFSKIHAAASLLLPSPAASSSTRLMSRHARSRTLITPHPSRQKLPSSPPSLRMRCYGQIALLLPKLLGSHRPNVNSSLKCPGFLSNPVPPLPAPAPAPLPRSSSRCGMRRSSRRMSAMDEIPGEPQRSRPEQLQLLYFWWRGLETTKDRKQKARIDSTNSFAHSFTWMLFRDRQMPRKRDRTRAEQASRPNEPGSRREAEAEAQTGAQTHRPEYSFLLRKQWSMYSPKCVFSAPSSS